MYHIKGTTHIYCPICDTVTEHSILTSPKTGETLRCEHVSTVGNGKRCGNIQQQKHAYTSDQAYEQPATKKPAGANIVRYLLN